MVRNGIDSYIHLNIIMYNICTLWLLYDYEPTKYKHKGAEGNLTILFNPPLSMFCH